jgi:hypothetical protein
VAVEVHLGRAEHVVRCLLEQSPDGISFVWVGDVNADRHG